MWVIVAIMVLGICTMYSFELGFNLCKYMLSDGKIPVEKMLQLLRQNPPGKSPLLAGLSKLVTYGYDR